MYPISQSFTLFHSNYTNPVVQDEPPIKGARLFSSQPALVCTMLYQAKMVEIFTDLHATYKNIPSRMKAESFKQRVVSCFKAWEVGERINSPDSDSVETIFKT